MKTTLVAITLLLLYCTCEALQQAKALQQFAEFLTQRDEAHLGKLKFIEHTPKKTGYVNKIKAVTTANVKEGDVLYSFSLKKSTINLETALNDPEVGEIFKSLQRKPEEKAAEGSVKLFDDQIVKLYLLHLKRVASVDWDTYLEILPSTFDTPLYWTSEELEELKGSQLYKEVKEAINYIDEEYNQLFPKLTFIYPDTFPANDFSQEQYKWATSVYNSRSWYKTKSVFGALSPLFDTFNYREEPSVKIRENDKNELELVATEDLEANDEVFINDGKLGNRDLLEFYGFTLEKNTADFISLGVGLSKEDTLYGNKKEFLHRKGIKDGQTFAVTSDKIPEDLIFALRVYHVSVYDYEDSNNAFDGKAVSSQNELKVCQTIIDTCQSALKAYKTTNKQDKELLKTEGLPQRKKNAINLRRSEKKILYKTLSKSKEILASVRAKWDVRTMDIPDGKNLKTTLVNQNREIL